MAEQLPFLLMRLLVAVWMLRVWMQLAQVDYYNPITAKFVGVLRPFVNTLAILLQTIGRFNLAAFTLGYLTAVAGLWLMLPHGNIQGWLIGGFALCVSVVLSMIFWVLLAMVIASWVIPHQNPWHALIMQLMRPIMLPVQRVIPNLGGLDLSPIVIFIGVQILRSTIEQRLFMASGL